MSGQRLPCEAAHLVQVRVALLEWGKSSARLHPARRSRRCRAIIDTPMLGRDNATIPLAATENVEKRPEGQSPLGIGRAMLPADRQPRSELLFLPVSVSALRISMDPSKVLNKDEMNAFEDLKAAGDHRFLKVGATVDNESGLVNLHFQRPLTAEDAQPLRRISKLGMLFFTLGEYGTLSDESLRFLDGAGMKGLFIWRQPITDSGLQALKLFPKLIDLVLKETRVTDAGLAQGQRAFWVI